MSKSDPRAVECEVKQGVATLMLSEPAKRLKAFVQQLEQRKRDRK